LSTLSSLDTPLPQVAPAAPPSSAKEDDVVVIVALARAGDCHVLVIVIINPRL
jgi:hypothetical protein